MTATVPEFFPIGLSYASVYALNASGTPLGTGMTAYEGVELDAPLNFEVTFPSPRNITHLGNNGVAMKDVLPPSEGSTANLTLSKRDYTMIALLESTKTYAVGEATGTLRVTNMQGFEAQFGLLFQQFGKLADGTRAYRTRIYPKATMLPSGDGFSQEVTPMTYSVNPSICAAALWGTAYSTANEGATSGEYQDFISAGRLLIASFLAGNSDTVFPFAVARQATGTAKIAVYVDGVLTSAGITKATTGVTFTGAPGTGKRVDLVYEW